MLVKDFGEYMKLGLEVSGFFIGFLIKFFGYNSKKKFIYIKRGSKFLSKSQIGYGSRINGKIKVRGAGKLFIGRFCAVGDEVTVITQNHDIACPIHSLNLQRRVYGRTFVNSASVFIGDNVWVGDRVTFLAGSSVGSNSIVAAGAVVVGVFEGGVIIGGVPAKLIRKNEVPLEESFWDLEPQEMLIGLERLGILNEKL